MIINIRNCPSCDSHPNTLVRQCTARHLANLVEKVGAARLLSGVKEPTERILHSVTKFVQDVSPKTRYVAVLFTWNPFHG